MTLSFERDFLNGAMAVLRFSVVQLCQEYSGNFGVSSKHCDSFIIRNLPINKYF